MMGNGGWQRPLNNPRAARFTTVLGVFVMWTDESFRITSRLPFPHIINKHDQQQGMEVRGDAPSSDARSNGKTLKRSQLRAFKPSVLLNGNGFKCLNA
jgi:hypothetical protein